MKLEELKNKVMHYVANGKLNEALELISTNDDAFEFSIHNDAVMAGSRLNSLCKELRIGTISNSNATMKRNQIAQSIIGMCDIKEGAVLVEDNPQEQIFVKRSKDVSFKDIKEKLKSIKSNDDTIYYFEAIDALSDLF